MVCCSPLHRTLGGLLLVAVFHYSNYHMTYKTSVSLLNLTPLDFDLSSATEAQFTPSSTSLNQAKSAHKSMVSNRAKLLGYKSSYKGQIIQ
jgi:hypothetical protein